MADKTVIRKEPVLRDCQFTIETDASGSRIVISCPQEGGVGGAVTVEASELAAGDRTSLRNGLLAVLVAAKTKWTGYGV